MKTNIDLRKTPRVQFIGLWDALRVRLQETKVSKMTDSLVSVLVILGHRKHWKLVRS